MLKFIKNLFSRKPTAKNMRNNPDPWIQVIKANLDPKNPKQGYFELEWNPAFINHLMNHGYRGPTAEDIVDRWFTDLCRNVSMDGVADGSFIADAGRIATNNKTKNQE